MLDSIGIEKGKSFTPEGKIKQALEQAAKDGFGYLEYMFETPGFSLEPIGQIVNGSVVL